jgi:DNA primase small subunit
VNKIQTKEFIQQKFAEHYKQHLDSIGPPSSMDKREYAFVLFKEKTMVRHKGFKRKEDFRDFLLRSAPSDVYYSSAYFEKPEAEMEAKGWLGADLVFDIDADHIPTPCDKQHDVWKCRNCDTAGHGSKPDKCPKCGGQKFIEIGWICETCLESAKDETVKLIEMLESDFGFPVQEMKLAFSGHRGYHVHIENPAIRGMDSMARKEIVDYTAGIGLEPAVHDFEKGYGPSLEDHGWSGRIAKGTYEFLLTATQEQLENAGLKKKIASQIPRQKNKILESWKGRGPWKTLKGVGPDIWKKILRQSIQRQSVKIDTVVTTDVHRLIRLADTLHGETGLKKVEFAPKEIERFDPLKSAVAFTQGTIRVDVSEAPQFRLGDNTYGPFRNQSDELPTAAAMFLLCKGVATIKEEYASVQ